MLQIVNTINSYLSDYILVFLLVAVGLWYTVKTKCVQRYLWKGLKQLFGGFSLRGGSQGGGMSSFQAVATAIAAQVGTGNIVGSAGAILVGGPGAIFWMWIIAFLGMATIMQKQHWRRRHVLQMQRAIFRADRCIISRQPLKANLEHSWQAFSQSQLFLLLDSSDAWYSPTQLAPQFRWHSGFRPGL